MGQQGYNFADVPEEPAGYDFSGIKNAQPNAALTFATHVGQQLNPIAAAQTLVDAAADPRKAMITIGAAQGKLFQRAKQSYDQGDYLTAARHFVDYLLPIIGPALDKSSDEMQHGDIAAGAGDAVGLGLALMGPKALGDHAAGLAKAAGSAKDVTGKALAASGKGLQKLADSSLAERASGYGAIEEAIRGNPTTAIASAVAPTVVKYTGKGLETLGDLLRGTDTLTASEVATLRSKLLNPAIQKNPQARAAIITALRTRGAKP